VGLGSRGVASSPTTALGPSGGAEAVPVCQTPTLELEVDGIVETPAPTAA